MSPLRRRKRRKEADLRLRARRKMLAERERQEYERERAGEREAEPAEAAHEPEPTEAQPEKRAARRLPAPKPASRWASRRRRRIPRPDVGGLRSASTTGARATVRQARPGVRRMLGGLGRALGWLLIWPLRLAALIERAIIGVITGLAWLGRRSLEIAERYATPERVLVLVTGGAAGCLVVSQFVAYRGVEVGQPQYTEVSSIAPPPQTDRIDAGAAHAYVLIPLAVIAVAIAVVALLSGRWRLGRLVSLVGLIGIAISLAIDLPKGLDAGTAGVAFAGAKATMTEGFYAQLAASAVLVLCGWVLSINLRQRAGAPARRRRLRRSRPRPRRAPSVAGGGA
jgi:hypothetical protein